MPASANAKASTAQHAALVTREDNRSAPVLGGPTAELRGCFVSALQEFKQRCAWRRVVIAQAPAIRQSK